MDLTPLWITIRAGLQTLSIILGSVSIAAFYGALCRGHLWALPQGSVLFLAAAAIVMGLERFPMG